MATTSIYVGAFNSEAHSILCAAAAQDCMDLEKVKSQINAAYEKYLGACSKSRGSTDIQELETNRDFLISNAPLKIQLYRARQRKRGVPSS